MKILRPLFLFSLLGACPLIAAAPPTVLTLRTLTAQMKFDQSELLVSPGSKVKLTFENPDDMPHNVVFCVPGTNVEELVMKMLEKPEEAMKRNFIPEDPRVWLSSNLLNPQEHQEIEFTAPEKPGLYPYVCSFPGHALSMKGVLKVLPQGPGLEGLRFSLYHGSWSKLPDFSKLVPHREGPVADNLIQLNFDDYKNQYGLVFVGKLNIPANGDYTFFTAGDDGVRLIINDEVIIDDDGIHPAKIRQKKKRLNKGMASVRVEYFQAEANAQLYVGWRSDAFDTTALSKWTPPDWKSAISQKKNDFVGMPLEAKGVPIVYRNFIDGAGNRSIGVGFKGGLSFAWSAETMSLALAWRGGFMDAARHWRNRGGGHQPPAGFDLLSPTGSAYPLAVQGSPDSAWPEFKEDAASDEFQWKGYSLDAKGVPSFRYAWKGVEVEDRVEAEGAFRDVSAKLVRTVKLQGKVPEKAFLIIAHNASFEAVPGGFKVKGAKLAVAESRYENEFIVLAEGVVASGNRLLIPAKPEIKISYSWSRVPALKAAN